MIRSDNLQEETPQNLFLLSLLEKWTGGLEFRREWNSDILVRVSGKP